MSKVVNKKPSSGNGSSLVVGLLVGLMIGMVIAAGLAWYLMRSPSPFVTPQVTPRIVAEPSKAAKATPPAAASAVGESSPRFEFYKVLTDKPDAAVNLPKQLNEKIAPATASKAAPGVVKPEAAAAKPTYFLQVGAFAHVEDAEKLKARLSLQGMEVSVQSVTTADKGVMSRVRTGPYQGADEMNQARAALKQNGMESTPVRAQ